MLLSIFCVSGAHIRSPPSLPLWLTKWHNSTGHEGYCLSLRNSSQWHMTLTDRCWKTDFLLYPTDVCLSPPVCSCMDQVVDASQMLDCLLTRPSYPTLWLIHWRFLATYTGSLNKYHIFGVRTPYHRTLKSQRLCKQQTDMHVALFCLFCIWCFNMQKAIMKILNILHCRDAWNARKPILIHHIPNLHVTKWVLNHLTKRTAERF